MIGRIGLLLLEPVALFEAGVIAEVFGVDRTEEGVPPFTLTIAAEKRSVATSVGGLALTSTEPLDALRSADLLVVPSAMPDRSPSRSVLDLIRQTLAEGGWVMGLCSGVYALAWAGVLDGRCASVHWRHARRFRETFPGVIVDDTQLYLMDDGIVTSAGTSAGIDACLELVRRGYGDETAARIARRMVVAPHRSGSQVQYIERPLIERHHPLESLLTWMQQNLAEDLSVPLLAERVSQSTRTFARQFRRHTGTTPYSWITERRLEEAGRLLSSTDLAVGQVARRVGLSDEQNLRRLLHRHTGLTPSEYRRQFGGPAFG